MFSDGYFSDVAALCGPGSSRHADTPIPDMAFEVIFRDIKHIDDSEAEKFKEKLDQGVLFSAKYVQRFGTLMLDRYQILYKKAPRSW